MSDALNDSVEVAGTSFGLVIFTLNESTEYRG